VLLQRRGGRLGDTDLTFNELPGMEFTSHIVIVDGARELHFSLSDNQHATVASGVAKRQTPEGQKPH
jgi:hypothetical protein